jgi:hypothetical protein
MLFTSRSTIVATRDLSMDEHNTCRKRVTPKRGGELGLLKLSLN